MHADIYEMISILEQEIHDMFLERIQNISTYDIDYESERYLLILKNIKEPSLSKFAKKAKISKPAVTKMIKKFIKNGYVDKYQDNIDKRKFFIQLKPEMILELEKRDKIMLSILSDVFSILSEDEFNNLKSILIKLIENNRGC